MARSIRKNPAALRRLADWAPPKGYNESKWVDAMELALGIDKPEDDEAWLATLASRLGLDFNEIKENTA